MITKTPKRFKSKKTHSSPLSYKVKHKSIWGMTLLWSTVACILGAAGGLFLLDHGKLINRPPKEDQIPQEKEPSPESQEEKMDLEEVSIQEEEIPLPVEEKTSLEQDEVKSEDPPLGGVPQEITEVKETEPDKTEENSTLTTELQNLLEGHEATLGFSGHFDVAFKDVERLYANFNFMPLWLTDSKVTPCENEVLSILLHSEEEGLEKEDYAWIEKDFQKFMEQSQDSSLALQEQQKALLKADILLTYGLIQYISDVRGERLSPKKIDKELFLEDVKIDVITLLINLIKQDASVCSWLSNLPPSHPQYKALKKALQLYREKASVGNHFLLFPKGATLKKGMEGERVIVLWKLLQSKGFIASHLVPVSVFDEILEEGVKNFQRQNNLQADGIVGSQTQNLLSRTNQEIIDQIIVTMERWRWMPPALGNKYVMINIPEFQARAYEKNELVFSMPIIVGRSYRETPVFASKIVNVIFNPFWNVPKLIAVADELPHMQKKGAEFLIEKGFHIYRDGVEVEPHTINWKDVTSKNFNFHLRQNPGDKNALGHIRFTIINPFDVYMHGTPHQELFSQKQRTFSSGCVRLEDPVKMAMFVFEDPKKWSHEALEATIKENKTQTIPLKSAIAVYFSYFTVFEEENGQLAFFEDVYGQDKEILKALKSRRSRAP